MLTFVRDGGAKSTIERDHLVERALTADLTVVSAPPGFGKTHFLDELRLACRNGKASTLQEIARDVGGIRLPMTAPHEVTRFVNETSMQSCSDQIDLLIVRIFVALVQGQISHATALLDHAEPQWAQSSGADRLKIETIRLIVRYHRGIAINIKDIRRIETEYADSLLDDPFAMAILHQVRCAAYFALGEYRLIAKSSLYVHETSVALDTPLLDDFRLVNLALVDFRLGRPRQAVDQLRRVISDFERAFGRPSYQASYVSLLLARILMENLEFAEGERLFNENRHASTFYPGWQPGMELILSAHMEIALRTGDMSSAFEALDAWETQCEPGHQERMSVRIALFRVQLLLRCGLVVEARSRLTRIKQSLLGRRACESGRTMDELLTIILSARLKAEESCDGLCGPEFRAIEAAIYRTGDVFLRLRALMVRYRCRNRARRSSLARATLRESLAFAIRHRVLLTLIDEWSTVEAEDSAALLSGPLHPEERALLEILRASEGSSSETIHDTGHSALSKRERQILGFLAEGMSSKEMAKALELSIGTIKGYRRRLYGKLKIYRRSEAVKAAHTFMNAEARA